MAVQPATLPVEAPVSGSTQQLPARQVEFRRAVRLGLVSGITVVFVSAIGMVEQFSGRDILADLSLGTALLGAIPFVMGFLAGQPPAQLQGFAPTRPGWRNPVAGVLTGSLTGAVMGVFVVLIVSFDVREVFINITPALAANEDGPRLLLFGRDLAPGLGLVLVVNAGLGAVGGALHLLDRLWRRAVLAGVLCVASFALLQPFVQQVLRGAREELLIETRPVREFLYEAGSLTIPAAVLLGIAGFAVYAFVHRPRRVPLPVRVRRLPDAQRRTATFGALAGLLVVVAVVPLTLSPSLNHVLVLAGIFTLTALGLNIVVGYAGMLDLGYVAFFAVGAYTTAALTSPRGGFELGWTFWGAVPFVLAAAAVAGLVVGTPVLRMRGDYLAIVTLGFGEITRLLFLSDWLEPYFGGAQGILDVPTISLGPLEIRQERDFVYALIVLIVLAAYVSYTFQNSRIGRAWMAMREDESVAEAMGVNIVTAKLSAFVTGAILAGVAGALFATNVKAIYPRSFEIIVSMLVLVVVITGGLASVRGVILGGIVLVGLPEMLREFGPYRYLLYGALLIFMMLRRPEGFIPSKRRAQELHEEDVAQDVWLRAEAEGNSGSEPGSGSVATTADRETGEG